MAKADSLSLRAVQLSHQPGSADAAERVASEAVAAYRTLERPTLQVKRKLAQALWRHAMLLAVNHGAHEALEPAREGVALARRVLNAADPNDPAFDDLIGETAIAMSDLSQISLAAGHQVEHDALLNDAIALCTAHRGPRGRHALGAALHNQAAAAADATQADIARGRHDAAQTASVLDALDRVVDVRRELADSSRPVTHWELADSLLLRGRLRCLLADAEGGVTDLLAAWTTLAPIGGAPADALRRQLRQAMRVAQEAYPHIVATLDWPSLAADIDGAVSQEAPRWKPAVAEALRLIERGQPGQAVAVLTPVAESGAKEAMHTLALLYGEMGQEGEANEWFGRAADAGNVQAMMIVGCQAADAGQLRDAERWFRRGADHGNAQAMLNLAIVLSAMGRTDESARWHRQGLEAQRS